MSNEQDWAEKKSEEIIKQNCCSQIIFSHIDNQTIEVWARTLRLDIALALKQEREIAKLESNKAIEWPEAVFRDDRKNAFFKVTDINGIGTTYVEYEWLKQTIKGLSE